MEINELNISKIQFGFVQCTAVKGLPSYRARTEICIVTLPGPEGNRKNDSFGKNPVYIFPNFPEKWENASTLHGVIYPHIFQPKENK